MSMELWQRLKDLEKKVGEIEKKQNLGYTVKVNFPVPPEGDKAQVAGNEGPSAPPASSRRGMCPKCGVKPNYYMHVKNCQGRAEVA